MPATPAWPPRSLPRLFVEQPLAEGEALLLEGKPAHYLANVLRLGEGAEVLLFDGHERRMAGGDRSRAQEEAGPPPDRPHPPARRLAARSPSPSRRSSAPRSNG